MKTGAKVAIGILGGLGLIAGSLALMGAFKKKDEQTGTGDASTGGEVPAEEGGVLTNLFNNIKDSVTSAGVGSKYTVSYVSERPSEPTMNLVVHIKNRPPAQTIKKGRKVKLSGMDQYNGIYTVKGDWTDDKGNQGAIYLYNKAVLNASKNESNTKWDGKGTITVAL